jgi:HPt (histidine-containing phosphotransfer) domain-containing protein
MNEAVKKADLVAVKRQSHKMKSSVSIMGMEALVHLLEEMEGLDDRAESIGRMENLGMQVSNLAEKAMQEVKEEIHNFS